LDQQGALQRYDQAKRDYYKGINKEDILPFLPTTKQIMENQAVRDVKGEMLMMRGHILTNFQKMRADVDNIKEDVAKGNTRFKYAQAEFQDSLKREMAMRDNQMIDVLDHIRQWNPNQVVHPQDHQYSQKHLSKVPDFSIPQLNFESVTNEMRQRLEELKNPHVFKNTAARKLEEFNSRTNVMVNPTQYIRPEDLRNGNFFVNPQSKYLDQVLDEERNKVEMERADRLRKISDTRKGTEKFSNHTEINKKPAETVAPIEKPLDGSKHSYAKPQVDISDNFSNEFLLESGGKENSQNPKNTASHRTDNNTKADNSMLNNVSKGSIDDSKRNPLPESKTNLSIANSKPEQPIKVDPKPDPKEDSKEIIEDHDGGLIEDSAYEEALKEGEEEYEYIDGEEEEIDDPAIQRPSTLPPINKPKP
jgi:hypothetical protein